MQPLPGAFRSWVGAFSRFVLAASFLNRLLYDFAGLQLWSYQKLFVWGAVMAFTWVLVIEPLLKERADAGYERSGAP